MRQSTALAAIGVTPDVLFDEPGQLAAGPLRRSDVRLIADVDAPLPILGQPADEHIEDAAQVAVGAVRAATSPTDPIMLVRFVLSSPRLLTAFDEALTST